MAVLSLRIRWRTFGPDKKYNIYYRRDDQSTFTKANAVPVADNINGNLYDIPGQVAPNTYYWVYVVETLNDKDAPECYIGQNPLYSFPIIDKVKIKTQSG